MLIELREQKRDGMDRAAYGNVKGLSVIITEQKHNRQLPFLFHLPTIVSIPHEHPDLPLEKAHQARLNKATSSQR